MNMKKKNLDKEVRENLSGTFIELEDGTVHYQIGGPNEGEPIVLVHGFSSPLFIWDPTYQFLVAQGFHADFVFYAMIYLVGVIQIARKSNILKIFLIDNFINLLKNFNSISMEKELL